MDQQKKIILFVCIGLLASLGISALIYFWPQLGRFGFVKPTGPPLKTQAPGRVFGLRLGMHGFIQKVTKDSLTVTTDDKTTQTYGYNTPRVYVLFRNKLGVKGYISDLKEGQAIEFSTSTDSKGNKIVTSIIIE